MSKLSNMYQSGDWKNEKHVPTIIAPESIKAGEEVEVKVAVGEEIAHPNTFEHHIAWIKLYFKPEGSNFPIEVATKDFAAHGEADVYTDPSLLAVFKTEKPGTILASSYCNIHGLWESSQELTID